MSLLPIYFESRTFHFSLNMGAGLRLLIHCNSSPESVDIQIPESHFDWLWEVIGMNCLWLCTHSDLDPI